MTKRVVEQVSLTLGVRIRDIKFIHSGSVVLYTQSIAKRGNIMANAKFAKVGLKWLLEIS